MQFVQIGMLGALGALAIPVIIHLMFRTQPRTVDLGTLQFLKAVLRDNARKRRLKRWLLLALRLACVALIALLFARPYLLATEPAEGERLVVVLVDRSASMGLKGGPRPIERALAEARAVAARAGGGTRLEVATFDQSVHPLARPADLRNAPAEPSASGTNYSAAMAWAHDLCVRAGKRLKEVHILTDLQRVGLDRGETVALPDDATVHLTDLGRAFPKNVAVTAVAASPASARPGESVVVTASVLNASPLPAEKVAVRLHIDAGAGTDRDLEKSIDLDGSSTASVEFTLPELPEGLWRGYVGAETDDDLPFDDRRYFALPVAPPPPVLLVDGDPGRTRVESETFFLQAALRLAPAGEAYEKAPFAVTAIDYPDGSGLLDLGTSSAVVLANVGDLSEPDAKRLALFVEQGGGLLVFTGDRVRAEVARVLQGAGLGVGDVLGTATADEEGLPFRLDRWDARHPIFRPFDDPEHGDLRRPSFTAITRVKADPGARVLAWFRGGEPAVLERSRGRGKVVWFTSACDRGWGDWPRGRLYVPMTHQLLAYVCGLSDGGRVREESAEDGRTPGVVESGGIARVVNADPFESETARCTPREFADRFGFRLPEPAGPATAEQSKKTLSDDRLRSDELWPWLALTLVGFLMLEFFLANRTTA
jgi:hypothetical protein